MKRFILCLLIASIPMQAQDISTYKRIVKELSSAKYQGRGYAKDGVVKAGKFIENEFRKAGADYVTAQPFRIDVNTFPGKMEVKLDGRTLKPGEDFSMREYSPGGRGSFNLYHIDTAKFDPDRILHELDKDDFVVCDFWFTYRHKDFFKQLQSADSPNAGLVYTWEPPLRFYKAYAEKVIDKPIIWVDPKLANNAKRLTINIENKFLEGYESSNIIARVDGTRHDSCYVFTAHYDHLGNLGSTVWYPGANDNASGTAAVITLARHYAEVDPKPKFDIYLIAFAGEDANLRGSSFFAEHPLMPLGSVKYLFNLDMIGDNNPVQYCEISDQGEEGFARMQEISGREGLFKELHRGKLAANSDHWPFAQKGVPCIMFENENGDAFKYYHTPLDNWRNAIFTTYPSIFKLVTQYIGR